MLLGDTLAFSRSGEGETNREKMGKWEAAAAIVASEARTQIHNFFSFLLLCIHCLFQWKIDGRRAKKNKKEFGMRKAFT
jgi:hypothetical protein